jgi:transcription elongation factor GreA
VAELKYEVLPLLESELQTLRTVRRKEIADALEYAKSLGDLSENAEYQEARELQANIEDRIRKIDSILQNAKIITFHHSDKVEIGSTVIVKKKGSKEEKTYKIVGAEEADMAAGKLSNKSPIGSAMLGKKKGEDFSFSSPAGTMTYTIVKIA